MVPDDGLTEKGPAAEATLWPRTSQRDYQYDEQEGSQCGAQRHWHLGLASAAQQSLRVVG